MVMRNKKIFFVIAKTLIYDVCLGVIHTILLANFEWKGNLPIGSDEYIPNFLYSTLFFSVFILIYLIIKNYKNKC